MAAALDEWERDLEGRRDPADSQLPVIEIPIKPSPRGGSGTFLAADATGQRWWVKPLNNNQHPRVTVTEAIIAATGSLIDAPVCESSVVLLPPEIAGWEFRPGSSIQEGYAHASRHVTDAIEDRSLRDRERDDNAKRHVGVFTLYDWCWGGDDQWLYAELEDKKLYSHDHGWYLPETGATWDVGALTARASEAHPAPWPTTGLDAAEIANCAQRLRALTHEALVAALRGIPESWPVSDAELAGVGWFLEHRAPDVAARLEAMGVAM